MAVFVAYGSDIVGNPNISTASGGQDGAGQITVNSGTTLFPDTYVIEFEAQNVDPDGEFSDSTSITGIKVYASQADYNAGTATYTYAPQNVGESAPIQDSLDRLGDNYIRFSSNSLSSSDPGAPSLAELFVAPGSNVANSTPLVFDRNTDVDYDDSGAIDVGTVEDGNGRFNIANSQTVCFTSGTLIQTPTGLRPIDDLRCGDLVQTADNGAQEIIWLGERQFSRPQLVCCPRLRPILVPEGVHGALRPTLLSRQHAILDRHNTLVAAVKLMRAPKSRLRVANGLRSVTYFHILCEDHQIVFANGIRCETFYPGREAIRMLTPTHRSRIGRIFPEFLKSGLRPQEIDILYGKRARPLGGAGV